MGDWYLFYNTEGIWRKGALDEGSDGTYRPSMHIDPSRVRSLGVVRLAVGLGLIAAPRRVARTSDPSLALLVRTIGVRDLVLGAGAVVAGAEGAKVWGVATLASDSLDVIAGLIATPSLGARRGLTAALVPVPFVAAGLSALRSNR